MILLKLDEITINRIFFTTTIHIQTKDKMLKFRFL